MSDKEYIDFKKEFEDFKKELEDSKPLFDDDNLDFTDFDDYNIEFSDFDDDSMESDIGDYPNLTLEDEKILLNLIIKKDYSKTEGLDERKEEFIQDLKSFIDEFSQTNEFKELLSYYDEKRE